jgi:hypothetical protein
MHLDQDKVHWLALVNTVMNPPVQQNEGVFDQLSDYQLLNKTFRKISIK